MTEEVKLFARLIVHACAIRVRRALRKVRTVIVMREERIFFL